VATKVGLGTFISNTMGLGGLHAMHGMNQKDHIHKNKRKKRHGVWLVSLRGTNKIMTINIITFFILLVMGLLLYGYMRRERKLLIIMRGIPGSGKSTMAKKFAEQYGGPSCIVSADDFFMRDDIYKFDRDKLFQAHKSAKQKFYYEIPNNNLIIVDNTNLSYGEFEYYIDTWKAREYPNRYRILLITVDHDFDSCCERNVHGVDNETLKKMLHKKLNQDSRLEWAAFYLGKIYTFEPAWINKWYNNSNSENEMDEFVENTLKHYKMI
jgi:predicted kinase